MASQRLDCENLMENFKHRSAVGKKELTEVREKKGYTTWQQLPLQEKFPMKSQQASDRRRHWCL